MEPNPGTNEASPLILFRVIVVALVQNDRGDYLICRMRKDRGVFPDQWRLPGGDIEDGERMEAALRRELREELGVEVVDITPLFFKDGQNRKSFDDGSQLEVYMIFLIFSCRASSAELKLSPEFTEYAWVQSDALKSYDLNRTTIETFRQAGVLG